MGYYPTFSIRRPPVPGVYDVRCLIFSYSSADYSASVGLLFGPASLVAVLRPVSPLDGALQPVSLAAVRPGLADFGSVLGPDPPP